MRGVVRAALGAGAVIAGGLLVGFFGSPAHAGCAVSEENPTCTYTGVDAGGNNFVDETRWVEPSCDGCSSSTSTSRVRTDPPALTTGYSIPYQTLQYGVETTFRKGGQEAGYPFETITVSDGDWAITNTVIGQKPRTVGVNVSYSGIKYFQTYDPIYNEATQTTSYGDAIYDPDWTWTETISFDRVPTGYHWFGSGGTPPSAAFVSAWQRSGIPGYGLCVLSYEGFSGGPYAPGSWDSRIPMPAVNAASGEALPDAAYLEVTPYTETEWKGEREQLYGEELRDMFLTECYPAQAEPLALSSGIDRFAPGRYQSETFLQVTKQRVIEVRGGGYPNTKLARAYIPSAGTYTYSLDLNPAGALTNPNAGMLTAPSDYVAADLYESAVRVQDCTTANWFRQSETPLSELWNSVSWPDNNSLNHYDSNLTCPAAPPSPSPPGATTVDYAGGDVSAGIYGTCVNTLLTPEVTIATGEVVDANGTIQVLEDNRVNTLNFHGDLVRIWVQDANGAGYDNARSQTPVERGYRNVFGGEDRVEPSTFGEPTVNTVSPSYIGTWIDRERTLLQEVNDPSGQPYSTVPWADVAAQRANRTPGAWEDLLRWIDIGTDDFYPGIGASFDAPSTPESVWRMQQQWRTTGVFAMRSTTPGWGGSVIEWSGGTPSLQPIEATPPPASTVWTTQTFKCTSLPVDLEVRSVVAVAGG